MDAVVHSNSEVRNVLRRFILSVMILSALLIPVGADTIKWVSFDVPYESLEYAME